ncbi:hypothetical protein B0H13DRAFT_1870851 [Mycena leptocephala]|nr:hypothetical protein B0H13DRAFT_1870851 [Mycena leptocephala]
MAYRPTSRPHQCVRDLLYFDDSSWLSSTPSGEGSSSSPFSFQLLILVTKTKPPFSITTAVGLTLGLFYPHPSQTPTAPTTRKRNAEEVIEVRQDEECQKGEPKIIADAADANSNFHILAPVRDGTVAVQGGINFSIDRTNVPWFNRHGGQQNVPAAGPNVPPVENVKAGAKQNGCHYQLLPMMTGAVVSGSNAEAAHLSVSRFSRKLIQFRDAIEKKENQSILTAVPKSSANICSGAGVVIYVGLSLIGSRSVAPSSWRNATLTMSSADRVSIASAALDKANAVVGPDGQFSGGPMLLSSLRPLILSDEGETYNVPGTFYYQMAEFDILTNGTNYQATCCSTLS